MKLWVVLAFSKHLIGLVDDVSENSSAIHVLQFEDCNMFLLTKFAVPVRKRFVAAKRSRLSRGWRIRIALAFQPVLGSSYQDRFSSSI